MVRVCLNCQKCIKNKHKLAKYCSIACKDSKWQENNHERMLIAAAKYRNSEKGRLNRQQNIQKINTQCKEWKRTNIERKKALDKAYHSKKQGDLVYLAKRKHHEAMRRARKLQATPKWLTESQKQQIKDLYLNCPKGYHVDHIVPLKGSKVSGLHVIWNLQWLPGIVNISKSNKVLE